MASAIAPGTFKIVLEDPFGNQFPVVKGDNNSAYAAGGSPDGVLANTTIDKQVRIGLTNITASGGWRVRLFTNLTTADGLDASDCVIQIPVTEAAGSERTITPADLGFTTDLPAATPAGYNIELGTGYSVPNNVSIRVGSATLTTPIVVSIQNDTA